MQTPTLKCKLDSGHDAGQREQYQLCCKKINKLPFLAWSQVQGRHRHCTEAWLCHSQAELCGHDSMAFLIYLQYLSTAGTGSTFTKKFKPQLINSRDTTDLLGVHFEVNLEVHEKYFSYLISSMVQKKCKFNIVIYNSFPTLEFFPTN